MLEPLISMRLRDQGRTFVPGEELECEYQVDAVEEGDIQTVEESVLWYTEGKGDEDMSVHYFHRRTRKEDEGQELRVLRRFRTILPNSPLSYDGVIVKLRWCARVRVFLKRGKEVHFEQPFRLGTVPAAKPVVVQQQDDEVEHDEWS